MKKVKVFFIIPTLFQGGGERVVSELSLHFPENIETSIVLFENKISYPFKGKIIDLKTVISPIFFLRIYYFFVRLMRFRNIVRKENPDYVISVGNSANILNLFSNKNAVLRADFPISQTNKGFWGFIFKVFAKLFFHKASKIIAVSSVAANDLIENFGIKKEKVYLIHNPIDIDKIQTLSKELLEEEYKDIFSHPVVITMGRLTKQKGQWHLIKAFKKIRENISNAQLVILGEGKLEGDLKRLVRGMNLENDVHFLGWQKNPFKFLARSKVFVLPSLWEGLPDVILEAMSCGLPIISSDCVSGPREILAPSTDINKKAKYIEDGEYGILVPVDNKMTLNNYELSEEEDMLSESLVRILKDTSLINSLRIKSTQRAEDFRIERIIKEWNFLK